MLCHCRSTENKACLLARISGKLKITSNASSQEALGAKQQKEKVNQ
jgi:hypothetical protein